MHSTWPSEFSVQSPRKRPRCTRLIRVNWIDSHAQPHDRRYETSQQKEALCRLEVRVLFRREHAQDIVVLVHGLAVVAPLLLVPPVGVGVTELALLGRRVDVATVLCRSVSRDLGTWSKRRRGRYHVRVLDVCAGEASYLSPSEVGSERKAGGSDGLEEWLGRSQPAGEHDYGVCKLSSSSDGHLETVNVHTGTVLVRRRFLARRLGLRRRYLSAGQQPFRLYAT